METRYHAFLDECGQRRYGPKTHPYFVVAGVITLVGIADICAAEFRGLKRAAFGDPQVEIKSHWLRRPDECQHRYLEPYGTSQKELDQFVDSLHKWMVASHFVLIAGVVDKPGMKAKYYDAHHPSGLGYLVLLQRYQKFLAARRCLSAVTFDNISGASPAGND